VLQFFEQKDTFQRGFGLNQAKLSKVKDLEKKRKVLFIVSNDKELTQISELASSCCTKIESISLDSVFGTNNTKREPNSIFDSGLLLKQLMEEVQDSARVVTNNKKLEREKINSKNMKEKSNVSLLTKQYVKEEKIFQKECGNKKELIINSREVTINQISNGKIIITPPPYLLVNLKDSDSDFTSHGPHSDRRTRIESWRYEVVTHCIPFAESSTSSFSSTQGSRSSYIDSAPSKKVNIGVELDPEKCSSESVGITGDNSNNNDSGSISQKDSAKDS